MSITNMGNQGCIIKTFQGATLKNTTIYRICYHTGSGDTTEEFASLDDAKAKADEGAAYTQQNISIRDEDGETVAVRRWYGTKYDPEQEDQENPIIFGTFGFYADWEDQ